jgi:hypothetical protein
MKSSLCVIAAALGAAAWFAQDKPAGTVVAVDASALRWEKAEGLPAGVRVARGTPDAKAGLFVDFIKFPAGVRVPLHWQGANQVVTVISGRLVIGGPGSPELEKGLEVGPGGFYRIPGRTPHWTWAKEESVIEVAGDAPNDLHWAAKP